MVQNTSFRSNPTSSYGEINRMGTTPDGRVVYQVKDGNGKIAGGLSVAPNDCDKFERAYVEILDAAPKLEKYMQTHTEEDLKQAQKKGRWITAIGAFTGGIIPAALIKSDIKILKIACAAAGTIAGLFAGAKIAKKVTIPPGAEEMSKATQEISKLDIKPL